MARTIYKIACLGFAFMALAAGYSSFLTMAELLAISGRQNSLGIGIYAHRALFSTGFFFVMLALAYFGPLALQRLFPEVRQS